MSGKNKFSKVSKHADVIIMSDSEDSHSDLDCDVCELSFNDVKSYKGHLQGKKHQKNVSESKFMAKTVAAQKNGVTESDDNDDDDDDDASSKLQCQVCDIYVSGYKSYAAHMKGSTHIKNVKKLKLKQKLRDMPEVIEKGNEEKVSDDDDLGKPYARCSTCQKEFGGPESLNLHLKSAVHKKKVKQAKTVQNLKSEYDDGSKKSDDEEFFSKCDLCQKSFSGVMPFQIHMKSNAHSKNVEKQKVAEEMKEHFVCDDANSGYVCKECKKTFTDPLAFKSHLAYNSHEKLKAKNAIGEFLTSHPEILFVTPFDKGDSEGSDEESDYYLICKVCHMSFSGPESAKDHVSSKKHISAKKEKKLLKLLKEQKKSPSDKQVEDKDTKSYLTREVHLSQKNLENIASMKISTIR